MTKVEKVLRAAVPAELRDRPLASLNVEERLRLTVALLNVPGVTLRLIGELRRRCEGRYIL